MKAPNITHSAALHLGLAVARAVGRNAHHLRAALVAHNAGCSVVAGPSTTAYRGIPTADLVKLEAAGLVGLVRNGDQRPRKGRPILSWSLTAEGRTLAGRL